MGVSGFNSVGAMVVPGSTTLTMGPLNTVVVGAFGNVVGVTVPGFTVVTTGTFVVVGATVVVATVLGGTTVTTVPVCFCDNLPDTTDAMQSTPGK